MESVIVEKKLFLESAKDTIGELMGIAIGYSISLALVLYTKVDRKFTMDDIPLSKE